MDYDVDPFRQNLIDAFGKPLEKDKQFHVNSPETFSYNCIAWAMGMNDRWVDHELIPWHWWPDGVQRNKSKQALQDAFIALGFEETTNPDYENGYDKVALYANLDGWTHAAKIVDSIRYHSKFGALNDAFHSGGNTLSIGYGCVYSYMRRATADAHITEDIKGPNAGEIYNEKIRYHRYPIVFFDGKFHDFWGNPFLMRGTQLFTQLGTPLILDNGELIEVNV